MDLNRDIEKHEYVFDGLKKDAVIETVHPVPEATTVNESDYARDPHRHPHLNWNPGFVRRFPWVGFGALAGVVACMAIAIIVLWASNGKSQTSKAGNRWPKQIAPSVILSGLSSISSLCFSLAIANGVAIAWWRQTLKGATIKQLHKSWSFATSMKSVFLAGRKFNTIALAALTAKLAIIDGVLMQSATKTGYDNDPVRRNVSNEIEVSMHQVLPVTGWVSPGDNGPGFMTDALRDNVNSWQTNILTPELYYAVAQGCEGICFANVTGAGFEFECAEPTITAIDWSRDLVNATAIQNNTALSVLMDALDQEYDNTMFKIAFDAVYSNISTGSYINMTLVYSETGYFAGLENAADDSCAGRRVTHTCTLWPATVNYPIMITNTDIEDADGDGKPDQKRTAEVKPQTVRVGAVEAYWMDLSDDDGLMLTSGWYPFDSALRQQSHFTILERKPVYENHSDLFPSGTGNVQSQLAGLEVAFNAAFGGQASLEKSASGYVLQQNGTAYSWSGDGVPAWDHCNYNFANPVNNSNGGGNTPDSIFGNINSLMFLVAADNAGYFWMNATGSTDAGTYLAANHTANIYTKSIHYHTNYWYMLGACISTFICILCVLPVYWGYWQLGRDVSLGPFEIAHAFQSPLTSEASQGSIKELMREVGRRPVRYGQYTTDDGRTVFVVADPDQLAELNRDTKAEFREQMGHVFSRERSQRTLQTLKTLDVKVEEKRDST